MSTLTRRRQDEAHAAATAAAREGHPREAQGCRRRWVLGQAQGDADIAVHQPWRPGRCASPVPAAPRTSRIGLDQPGAVQFCRYPLVQSFHAPWAAAARRSRRKRGRKPSALTAPSAPRRHSPAASPRRRLPARALQVVPVLYGARRLGG
ncbi:hypothetical protein ACPA9J_27985 [Pseudomonas aeruginosa]